MIWAFTILVFFAGFYVGYRRCENDWSMGVCVGLLSAFLAFTIAFIVDGCNLRATGVVWNATIINHSYTPSQVHTGTGVGAGGAGTSTVVTTTSVSPEQFIVVVRTDDGEVCAVPVSRGRWADLKGGDRVVVHQLRGRFFGFASGLAVSRSEK